MAPFKMEGATATQLETGQGSGGGTEPTNISLLGTKPGAWLALHPLKDLCPLPAGHGQSRWQWLPSKLSTLKEKWVCQNRRRLSTTSWWTRRNGKTPGKERAGGTLCSLRTQVGNSGEQRTPERPGEGSHRRAGPWVLAISPASS